MYHLAIDLGGSSGRHILGKLENGKVQLEEIHRFKNGVIEKNGQRCWDSAAIFEEILIGLEKCKAAGKVPDTLGIDAWGVDFMLLDKAGEPLGETVSYRDERTKGIPEAVNRIIPAAELYARTGTQSHDYNTMYQFLAMAKQQPQLFNQGASFLLMPEYFAYRLSGVQRHEYTIASTTGLVSPTTNTWDLDLAKTLGLPTHIFGDIATPGTIVGDLCLRIQARVGFNCQVVMPCAHDTASAVVSAPLDEHSIFLSSGTWSLIGAELPAPVCTEASRLAHLTNEGGYGGTYRFLKNIMGQWLVQSIKAENKDQYSFPELALMAKEHDYFPSRIDVNDPRFMAPLSMTGAISSYCMATGQQVPKILGETMYCIYQSLADSYAKTARALEHMTGKDFSRICIIGGGSQDSYLNQLTEKTCGKSVSAGPVEATALGNILVQMMATGAVQSLSQARSLIQS